MKLNDKIMVEAAGLLEYAAPEMTELDGILMAHGEGRGGLYGDASTDDIIFNADGDGGEENGTFSLDE